MDIFYHRIFEHTPDALLVVDSEGCIRQGNARVEALFGYSRDELIGHEVEILVPERLAARHVGHRARFAADPKLRHMGASLMDAFARRKDGSEIPVDIMISTLDTTDGVFFLCAVRDVTERKATMEELRRRTAELEGLHVQLKELASHDSLTGLLNRRAYQEQTEWIIRNAVRQRQGVSLLMIDLDFFKRVNDQFGHAEGDRVLFLIANILNDTCRQNDVSARYGGEEFAVTLPDTDEAGSFVVAENFRTAVEAIKDPRYPVTASVGIATFVPDPGLPPADTGALYDELINRADQALYAAKNNGRNQVCHFNEIAKEMRR
ncbi:MAG: diguanylate cyclase [Betaproteobacteria bacterium]|nr:diguanylate cyclase [Betaproteobacteria bacterium]